MNLDEFGALLTHYMDLRDQSDLDLARRLAIHPSTVARWRTGETRPKSPELVIRIADCLAIHGADRTRLLLLTGYAYQAVTAPEPTMAATKYQEVGRPLDGKQQQSEYINVTNVPLIKLLFLAANPLDTARLRTDEEARSIDQSLRQADYRMFDIRVHQAVRIDDLQDLIMRHNPDILHFSGHGSEANQLILHDTQGKAVSVGASALSRLFGVLKSNIRCVVLNACYTEEQSTAIAEVIDCVVGIKSAISDDASLQFSTAFYRALGYGRSVQQAFEQGQVQVELMGLGEITILHLHTRRPDSAQIRFVDIQSKSRMQNAIIPASTTQAMSQVMPNVLDDTAFLRLLLAQHRRNLQLLLLQKANFGAGEEPLSLLNKIAAEEDRIVQLQQQLGT